MKQMKTREDAAAKLLLQLEEVLGETGLKEVPSRLKALERVVGDVKKLDVQAVQRSIERLKAGQDQLRETIRKSRRGGYVSGIEDVGKEFSVLRALLGKRLGWKEANAEFEYEVIKQCSDKLRDEYRKAGITIGDDKSAGSFIPDQVIPDIIGAIYTKSVFVALEGEGETRITVLEGLTGANVTIPAFTGGMIAYWIGEEDEYAESLVGTDDVTMNPKKLGVLVKITDEMRRFAGFGFENLLRRDMVRAAAKKLDYTIAYGSGSNKTPRGIVNTNGIAVYSAQSGKTGILGTDSLAGAQFQADWQGAELDFDGLSNMMLAIEEADIDLDETATWISAPRYYQRLKQLKVSHFSGQTTEKSYLIGIPMLPDSRLMEIIGPYAKSTQIKAKKPGSSIGAPTTSSNVKFTDVFGGNLGEVVLGRWSGLEIDDDAGKGKGFTSDAIYTKMRLWADTTNRRPESVVVCPDAKILS